MFKSNKILMIASLIVLAFSIGFNSPVDAGSSSARSSGSSFSSSSSRSFSSTSYSKPSSPTISGSGYSKPSASPPIAASPNIPDSSSKSGYSKPAAIPAAPIATSPQNAKPDASSNAGYSKPSASVPAVSTSGYSKPGTGEVAPVSASTPAQIAPNALSIAASKSMSASSFKAYQAERANAKASTTPIDLTAVKNDPGYTAAKSSYSDVNSYMTRRTIYVNDYRTRHPDVYVYSHSMNPYYGTYDNSFLLGMVFGYLGSNSANNASWFYSHQNDPWYPQWRADMDHQAQDNAELKAKLASIDSEVTRLKSQNAPISTALPEGVDSSLAIAPEVMLATEPTTDSSLPWVWIIVMLLGSASVLTLVYFYIVGNRRNH